MPESPYLAPAELKPEIPFTPDVFDKDDSEEDPDGNTEWDRYLAEMIDEESERIEGWAGTVFEVTDTEETLNGSDANTDGRDLPLGNLPVRSVNSVEVDGDVLPAEDYYVADAHIEHLDGGWPAGRRNVVVTYQYGHDDLPGPLREGLIRLVRSRLEQRKSDGLESESSGDTSYTYRPSSEIRAEVRGTARQHSPSTSSYHVGASLI